MKKLVYILIIILFSACTKQLENKKDTDSYYAYYSDLKAKVINNGDKVAYDKLWRIYKSDANTVDLLAYSMIMANEYNYARAFFDVFEILYSTGYFKQDFNDNYFCVDYSLECLGNETKKTALEYLKLAIEKGDYAASETVLNFYDKGKSYPIKELYENKELIKKAKENISNK